MAKSSARCIVVDVDGTPMLFNVQGVITDEDRKALVELGRAIIRRASNDVPDLSLTLREPEEPDPAA